MSYRGRYEIFDPTRIATYPVAGRRNRVTLADLIQPESVLARPAPSLEDAVAESIHAIAGAVVSARRANHPVIVFSGAHPFKNGLGPLFVDLMHRGLVTLIATNCAGAIHDFELALAGQTSEDVPDALPRGQFGMAYEFCYFNQAVKTGYAKGLGMGESLGRMICDDAFRERVLVEVHRPGAPRDFSHPEASVLAAAIRYNVPFTVHVTVGTDVVNQHPSFDAAASGGASGWDFLIFAENVAHMTEGGVVLNLSCAVTGPEVLLKAVSMAANVGRPPKGIIAADFDLRPDHAGSMEDETSVHYYFRDQKSIVVRIPRAFGGVGYYVRADHRRSWPALYREIVRQSESHLTHT